MVDGRGGGAAGLADSGLIRRHLTACGQLLVGVRTDRVEISYGCFRFGRVHHRRVTCLVGGQSAVGLAITHDRAIARSAFDQDIGSAVQSQLITFQFHPTTQAAVAVGAQHRVAEDQLGRRGLAGRVGIYR